MLKCNDFPELSLSFSTLVHLLRYRAQDQPDRIAFTFLPEAETASFSLTYQELDQRSQAIAAQLQELNLSGERALLLYPPGLDYLTAFFGCLYAGVVAVPAYPPRNQRNTPRIQAVVADAGAAIALTTTAIQSKTQSLLQHLCKDLQWLTTDNLANGIEANWQQPLIDQDTLAFLQYTSGSTGTPKGVMLSHGNLLHNATMTYHFMGHSPSSKFVSWLPTYHDMGLIGGILQPLYGGFLCILMSPVSFLQRPYRWLETISRYQGTTSGGPNFAYELCIQKITAEQRETLDLSSWSVAFNGAEPIRQDTLERFSAAFASCGFRKEAFYLCYGLAEASLMVSGSRKLEPPVITTVQGDALERNQVIEATTSNENVRTLVSCGQTLTDQQIVIAHPDTLNRCLPDEVGEIWVSGSSIGKGYWNRTEETEQTFCAYLSDSKEGPFLRTGDLGFLHNGELFITGRAKDLIIIRGRNLYPQDIELTAERSHASLRTGSGAAFSVQVSNEEQLVVVQEVEFRQKPNVEEVTAAIRQAVTEEHEVQVYAVVLIKAGSIAKTSSGKIQRRACKAEFLAGNLSVLGSSILDSADFEECDRPKHLNREALLEVVPEERLPLLESYLHELVARVLRITPSFGLQQPISTLGLDSLKVFELKNQIEVDFGVVVSVVDLFEGTSIAQLAKHILAQLAEISVVSAIQPISRNQDIPLSFAQERLWFLDQLEPGNSFYNLSATVRLSGELNIDAIAQSLKEIIRRHEVLRTTFSNGQGEPIQIISSEVSFTLPMIDLSNFSESKREAEIQRLSIEEARLPFDLTQKPLLRAKLLRVSEKEHTLLLAAHHIIFDGWSMGVFVQELATLYQAFSSKNALPLLTLSIQYADFAQWQRQWLQGEVLDTQLAYWKQQLSGSLPVLNLPTDFQRPAVQTYHGARQEFKISKSLTEALTKLSQREGTTLFMTLLAGFKTLLYRYTNQEDILVGSPIANRNRAEIENLIGFFVNTLVLRTSLSNNPSFKELLRRVRETALGGYAHQDLPFEKLVEELQPTRSLSRSPLFQVMFQLRNMPMPSLQLPGLNLSLLEVEQGTTQFDLSLDIEEVGERLKASIEYSTDLFDAATITRMSGHLQTLLESIVANPDQRISDLPLLTQAEQQQLWEWNNTKIEYPQVLINQLFEQQVKRNPDAIAVVCEQQQLSYQELNTKANLLAHYLRKLGVGADVLVGICVERSLETIIGTLGILKAGGAYLPLDPAYPQHRLALMLADAQVPIFLTQKHLSNKLPEHQAKVVYLDADWQLINQENQENPVHNSTAENIAYVIYTSGSTGKPKGVMIAHKSLSNYVQAAVAEYGIEKGERILQFASLSFDTSAEEIFPALATGATLVLRTDEMLGAVYQFLQKCQDLQVTVLDLPTAYWHELTHAIKEENLKLPPSIRLILIGGEKALPEKVAVWRNHIDNSVRLVNTYGPTEATIVSTKYELSTPEAVNKSGNIPIGKPIHNVQTYILDSDLRLVPIGVIGELYIGGAGLGKGYLNRPELTAENFIINPYAQTENNYFDYSKVIYKTGDLARYLPDGNIEYLGRIDNQVKIRGFRIELGEIEAAIRQHPEVKETVVLVWEDYASHKQLVAYIVFNGYQDVNTSEIRNFLKEKLPEYMVPATFVTLSSLPLTPNGKVDKGAFPAPDKTKAELNADFVAPRTTFELRLAEIWAIVLGVEKVGIYDNFFELGGHSLLATQLIAKVRTEFQVDLPLRSLFASPTVESLAVAIAAQEQTNQDSLVSLPSIVPNPQNKYQPFPLNEMQQAYWVGRNSFFEMGNVAIHGYVEIENENLDLESFELAWKKLVQRHDMLRAIVHPDGQQQILEQVPNYKIQVLDLTEETTEVVNSQLAAIREYLSHQVISLDQWPLFEIRATKFHQNRIRLHISIDALCIDGWSYQILFRDLVQLYQNSDINLPSLELSFRDYVLALFNLQNSTAFKCSLEYWQNRIATLPPAPELPLAKQPSSLQQPKFKRWDNQLAAETWQKLKKRAGKAGLSPTGLLLAAYAEVLSLWGKNPHFTLNVPRFNRLPLHPQVNDLIGEFASFTLLEVNNSQPESFEIRAQRLQAQLWEDLEHQYVSGVRVLRELAQVQGRTTGTPMPIVFTIDPENNTAEKDTSILSLLAEIGDLVYILGQTPQVWIDAQFSETSQGLFFNWDAVAELFPDGMIDNMFAAYCNLLQGLATDEAAWQETSRQLLPERQLKQRSAINDNDAPIPDKLLHTLFAEQVPQRHQNAAIITPNYTLSYAELFRRSNQLGHRLRSLGVLPNQLVAVVMDKGWEQIVSVLGILAAGAAYLPIDSHLPKERLWYVLENGEVEVILTQSWLHEIEFPANVKQICVDTEELAGESEEALEPVQQADDLAYVIYTSGSTGMPKGVTIAHRGVVNAIAQTNQFFNVGCEDRVLALTALYHDMSVYDIFGLLAAGGTIVMPDACATRDAAHWAKLMRDEQVTIWNSVPAMMEMLLEYAGDRPEVLPSGLRWAFLGGDWIPMTLPNRLKALVAGVQVVSVGGPTETTLWNIWYPVEAVDPAWKSIPYGQPIANTQYYILNSALSDCPVWVPGEMYCAGVGLTKGYWRNEEKTRASFINHPVTGERLYRTGDLGRYLPDGNIEFLGREDFRLKIRGYRIEAGEIEATLAQHPAVRSSVVTTVGEQHSNQRLVAYLVLTQDSSSELINELRRFLSEKLPEYMVPSAFTILDALPLSPNGKVNRRALPEPNLAMVTEEKTFVAPRNPVEEALARIWSEILGLERVSIYDDFFDLGGHSLLATQLLTKVRQTFQVELILRDLFEMPTIAGLAKKVSETKPNEVERREAAIVSVSRDAYRRKRSSLITGAGGLAK